MSAGLKRRLATTAIIAVLSAGLIPVSGVAGADSPDPSASKDAAATVVPESWIVTLEPRADPAAQANGLARAAGGKVGHVYVHALHGFAFKGSAKAAAALKRNPNVRTVVPDRTVSVIAETVAPGIKRIRARHPTQPDAAEAGFTGEGVRVAVLDTGVDLTHPDLVANLDTASGRNCMDAGPPQDGHGHGTHVAGIIAAVAGNGIGVAGVAPDATIVPIRVLDNTGNGEWSNVICGIDYLTGLATDGPASNDVLVANMSLGDVGSVGNCSDGGLREAICTSVAAGITYVAAAGNSTVNASTFIPAAFPEVITVSAMIDRDGESGGLAGCLVPFLLLFCDDNLAEFSNYGSVVDVTAPGFQVYSSWTGGGYQNADGTSMAAPHAAGVAALVKAADPSLSPADVESVLKVRGECENGVLADADGSGDCVGKGQWGNDPDGYGEPLVNALHAAESAGGFDPRPTVHITSPADGSSVAGVVGITATATDDIGVVEVSFRVNGVVIATDTDGSDGWSASWDSGALEGGAYELKATAVDTAGGKGIDRVTIMVGSNRQGDWVGHYGSDGRIQAAWNGSTDLVALPSGVSYVLEQGGRHTWASPTTDVRALESPSEAERRAAGWYDASQTRVRLNFTAPYTGTLHLYAIDWDTTTRRENVTVDDGSGPRSLNLTTSFAAGAWLHYPIAVGSSGSVVISLDNLVPAQNAVLSGIFLGGGGPPIPPPPPPTMDSPGVQGDWVGHYGSDGRIQAAWNGSTDLVALPSGVSYVLEQGGRHTWASPTTDVRALESPSEAERRAAGWYDASQTRVRLNFTAPYTGTLHLYAIDWDTTTRRENVTVDDGSGPRSLNLTTSFAAGAWLHYPIAVGSSGSVVISLDNLVPAQNAVLSGIFLGGGAAPTVPGAPTGLTATGGNGQVGLTWTAPASNGGSAILDYTATAAPGGATCTSATTGCTISGLTNGTAYSFTVRARNAVGSGPASNTANATPATVPGAPNLTAATAGNAQVALTWTAPASNGGSAITGYTATASPGGATCASASLGCTISGLTNGQSYSFTVTATNAVGTGPASNALQATPAAAPTVPGAPTGLTATGGNGQVGLTWTAPASNGGSAILDYTATAAPGGATCTSATTGCTISGLTNGTAYSFTVRARNAVGSGPASNTANATPATVPGAPNLTAATAGNAQVALTWTAPASNGGSAITGYTATASPGGATCASASLGCTISGLTNGQSYSFTVTATNAVGTGPASNALQATPAAAPTVPGAPTGLTATGGNGQVGLTWTAPASNGGSAILDYTATAAPGGATCTSATTGCTISGLTNGTAYSFTVRARNAVGSGPASNTANATPATVPGAPNLTAATAGNAQVALTWTAPASNGGSAITGYTATASPGGATCASASLGCTISGLTNGQSYSFTVTATNAVGTGPASNALQATPAAAPTVPGVPTGLTATGGNGQVGLTWTAPASNGGSALIRYRIYRGTGAGKSLITTLGTELTSFIDLGRTNGTTYYYQVSVTNAVGESARSNEASATPSTTPSAPRSFTAKPHKTRGVNLTWSTPASNGGSAVTGYRIYRSTSSGGEDFLIAIGTDRSYLDTDNTPGIRYYYVVAAVNAVGEGLQSGESSAVAK